MDVFFFKLMTDQFLEWRIQCIILTIQINFCKYFTFYRLQENKIKYYKNTIIYHELFLAALTAPCIDYQLMRFDQPCYLDLFRLRQVALASGCIRKSYYVIELFFCMNSLNTSLTVNKQSTLPIPCGMRILRRGSINSIHRPSTQDLRTTEINAQKTP